MKLHMLLRRAFPSLETRNRYIIAYVIRVLLFAFKCYVMQELLSGVTLDDQFDVQWFDSPHFETYYMEEVESLAQELRDVVIIREETRTKTTDVC